jgi:FkbM family methyltransferase
MIISDEEEIKLWFDNISLKKYNLSHIGYEIKTWLTSMGVFNNFINEQYRYRDIVNTEKGDYVIDGGACYGDTALYFSIKSDAKVYAFEFLEENLNIFKKNMLLNPQHAQNITLVEKPLSSRSGKKFYAISNVPGMSITTIKYEHAKELHSISIDDYVEQNRIPKIDFIKLDVECSEADVLNGAIRTIRTFKPKLAICVYHKYNDLWTIPQLIKEILPEYNLYLDHHTINNTETVIYATVKESI